MAQLAGKSVMAIYQLAVDDYAASYAGAEGNHYKVLEAASGAVGHLAYGGSIGVIGDGHGYAEFFADQLSQRYGRGPGEVDGILNHAGIVIGIGRADTYAVDFALGVIGLYQSGKFDIKIFDKAVYGVVFACFDGRRGYNHAASIDDAEYGIGSAQVYTYYVRFHREYGCV